MHLSCHLNNLNPTQNVYLRKRLNIFTWSSRRSLIRYANSITFLCLSRTMFSHCPHERYRDGAISRLATRPQIMTQRMDKLLLHRATRRATSITVFARHARNFGHAGFPRWLHVTLMHGWARARVRARTRRNKGGYVTRPRKAQKVQRSPITDATPVPPPSLLFPSVRQMSFFLLAGYDTRAFRVRKLRTMTARLHDRDRSANRWLLENRTPHRRRVCIVS